MGKFSRSKFEKECDTCFYMDNPYAVKNLPQLYKDLNTKRCTNLKSSFKFCDTERHAGYCGTKGKLWKAKDAKAEIQHQNSLWYNKLVDKFIFKVKLPSLKINWKKDG